MGQPEFVHGKCVKIYGSFQDISDYKKISHLYEETSEMAKIGSWELDLTSNNDGESMYWSPIVRKIIEVDTNYNASLTGGIEFYSESSKPKVEKVIKRLIEKGTEYDEEVLLTTSKGQEKWVRIIGKSERLNGECTKIFGSIQDIHTMKTTQLQLKEILDSISDAFYAVDAQWNFTYFNKEAERMLGKKSKEVLGKNIWDIFAPVLGTPLETIYRKVAVQGKSESFEYYYPGNESWYEINAYPSNGGVSAYFKNIDERRKAEEQLQKAYKEKNQILESIGDAFFAVDNEWDITYWNKEAERVLGRKRDAVLGKNLWQQYDDAVELDFYKEYHKAMDTGKTVFFEEFYPALNKWFEVTAYPSGKGLSVYFKDITLRKETDIKILEANERFEKVTKATTDAIWDWDLEQDNLYSGDGFEKLLDYQLPQHHKGAHFWQKHIHPEDIETVQSGLQNLLNDSKKEYWNTEYRMINEQGMEKAVITKGVVIRNQQGNPIRMVGAVTDISERKRHERELYELNKALKDNIKELETSNEQLEQFAFIASHDLQEPLRMITSFLNLLQRKYGEQLDEKAHQYIFYATDGAARMKQIILDLLDYSRAGKLTEQPEAVNVNEILEEYRALRRKLIQEKNVTLQLDHFPELKSYKAPLTQTLHCLLDNAIKYSKPSVPPIIKVSVKEFDTYRQIDITDNGIGIAPEYFDKIFIIFQRLHNRDRHDGTGIGLSICKKNVESWGGKIWVESVPNKGSTFSFTINK